MSDWKQVKLGEVAEIQNGYAFKSKDLKDSRGVPVIKIKNIASGKLLVADLMYYDKPIDNLSKFIIKKNDILIAMTGSHVNQPSSMVGKTSRYNLVKMALLNQRVGKIYSLDINELDEDFLYFFLIQDNIRYELALNAGGSANQANISPTLIKSLDFLLPPISEQKVIASVLSSLDDKIDLLQRENKTLEALAETLFRQWFVEEAEEEWKEKPITELFEIRDGTHDSPKQNNVGKPLLTSKHILNNRLDIENAYLISEDDFENVNKRSKVEKNDILFSMIGTIGLVYLEQSTKIDYCIKNIGLFKTSQNPKWTYFTYLWLKSSLGQEFIYENRSGSTQEYISLGSLRSIVFNIPQINVIESFNKVVEPLFNKLRNNISQICTLEKYRDTLLPKLMSGEVRVDFKN